MYVGVAFVPITVSVGYNTLTLFVLVVAKPVLVGPVLMWNLR